MPKQIKSYHATPIFEFLNDYCAGQKEDQESTLKTEGPESENLAIATTRREFAACLRDFVNPDACANNFQKSLTRSLISQTPLEYTDFTFAEMVVLINSFHTDCLNCLNSNCKHRDPEKPIEL